MQVRWYLPVLHLLKFSNRYSSPKDNGSLSYYNYEMVNIYFLEDDRFENDDELSGLIFRSIEDELSRRSSEILRVIEEGFKNPFFKTT